MEGFDSIVALAKKYRSGEITATDNLQKSLETIKKLNPEYNAFISLRETSALAEAEQLDKEFKDGNYRGPLHGVPVAVKANIDVEGCSISSCAEPLKNRVASVDSSSVKRLKEAGAIVVGITNMHELAYGGTGEVSFFGAAKNPHDPTRIAGGSSSGSAASVASKMVPVALGTDTGGSVRIPASACGIVGYKPSYGMIDTTGVLPLSWTLDHVGTMAHSVIDAGLSAALLMTDIPFSKRLISEIASIPILTASINLKNVRIGLCQISDMGLSGEVQKVIDSAFAKLLEQGAVLNKFSLKHAKETHISWLNIMYSEASSYYGNNKLCDYRRFSSSIKTQLEAGMRVPATAYLDAQRFRKHFMSYFDEIFSQYEVVCLPTLPVAAPKLGGKDLTIGGNTVTVQDAMTFTNQIANLLGCAAISIPAGSSKNGLPIGLTLLMPYGRDFELIKMAANFEKVFSTS